MRFLVDECVSRGVSERLVALGHDVVRVVATRPGTSDSDVLRWSVEDARVLVTEDWDFGDLAVRRGEPAHGIAIVAISQFTSDAAGTAESIARVIDSMGQALLGTVTVIGKGRVRQRSLKP